MSIFSGFTQWVSSTYHGIGESTPFPSCMPEYEMWNVCPCDPRDILCQAGTVFAQFINEELPSYITYPFEEMIHSPTAVLDKFEGIESRWGLPSNAISTGLAIGAGLLTCYTAFKLSSKTCSQKDCEAILRKLLQAKFGEEIGGTIYTLIKEIILEDVAKELTKSSSTSGGSLNKAFAKIKDMKINAIIPLLMAGKDNGVFEKIRKIHTTLTDPVEKVRKNYPTVTLASNDKLAKSQIKRRMKSALKETLTLSRPSAIKQKNR